MNLKPERATGGDVTVSGDQPVRSEEVNTSSVKHTPPPNSAKREITPLVFHRRQDDALI